MRKRLWRRSLWLILILLSVSLSGSGCKFTITVIDKSGCGGTVTPTSGTVGSCKDFTFTIDPGSCERYSVLVDGDEIPECCPDNQYTGETEWKGTVRVIVVFYGEESELEENLDLGDIEFPDDDDSDGIVIIDGGIPTDKVIEITPTPEPTRTPRPPPPPPPPSCRPLGATCSSDSNCCTLHCSATCYCLSGGMSCSFNVECCSGICGGTTCM
jgi:hypothetical protein